METRSSMILRLPAMLLAAASCGLVGTWAIPDRSPAPAVVASPAAMASTQVAASPDSTASAPAATASTPAPKVYPWGGGAPVCPPSAPWWHGEDLPPAVNRECFSQWGLELAWVNEEGPVVVSKVLSYFPAERAGIRPGDMLFSVNGTQARGKSPGELLGAMSPVLRIKDDIFQEAPPVRLIFARDEKRVRATLPHDVSTYLAGP